MFPDSDIAKGYKQSETKVKYSIQFRLASYFMQSLQDDFLGRAFSFKFDETATSRSGKTVRWLYTTLVEFYEIICYILEWTVQM